MNFELSNTETLNRKYGQQIEALNEVIWSIDIRCCGCSGDCGSNWMRS